MASTNGPQGSTGQQQQPSTASLQIAYENAKARGSELAGMSKAAPAHLRPQLLLAAKTYHAMSTVIFSSICMNQISDLEDFIQTSAQSLPPSLFDAREWVGPMKHAEETRSGFGSTSNGNVPGNDDIAAFKAGRVADMQKSLALLTKDVSSEISTMTNTLASFKTQLVPLLKKETQRYSELQKKFSDIDDNNQKALKALTAEYEEKLVEAKESNSKALDELNGLNSNFDQRVEDMKYSYEAEIDRLKDIIASFEASEVRVQNSELKQTMKNQHVDIVSTKQELTALKELSDLSTKKNVSEFIPLLPYLKRAPLSGCRREGPGGSH
jgi:vacuolar-type H+-ATPase subunit I/STV1